MQRTGLLLITTLWLYYGFIMALLWLYYGESFYTTLTNFVTAPPTWCLQTEGVRPESEMS
jgi:hypothetical protein